MSHLRMSSEFELDDDGILQDNGFQLDDDGVLIDGFDVYTKTGGHWTDSGFGGDRQSSQSTLRHTSFEYDLQPDDDRSINISEFEASREDIDLDNYSVSSNSDPEYRDIRHSFDGPQRLRESSEWFQKPSYDDKDNLFTDNYYQQLRDLGVLVDGSDFENNEQHMLLDLTDLDKSYSHENLFVGEGNVSAKDTPSVFVTEDDDEKLLDVGNVVHNQHKSRLLAETRSSSTISSRSFPEITPEEAEELYVNKTYKYVDKKSAFDFYNNTGNSKDDDDEIYFITSRIPPSKSSNLKESLSVSPNQSNTSTRLTSPTSHTSSRPHTPYSREIWQHQDKFQENSENQTTQSEDLHVELPERANTATPHEPKPQRPLSSSSHRSTGSDNLNSRPSSGKKLPKAVSQESFFDTPRTPKSDKMPKRILPKPNAVDEEEYKIKCKSTTNISGKSGPVKPTHMTISEITRITMDENDEADGKGKGEHVELSTKLKQEFSKRKQATELVQQLQKDYDSLLSKYALAELTIDQMRLGARINLYADSPTPNQIQMSSLSGSQSIQTINLGSTLGRGLLSASPSSTNRYLSPNLDASDIFNSSALTSGIVNDSRSTSCNDKLIVGHDVTSATDDRMLRTPSGAEQVKASLMVQTKNLDQRIQSFESIVGTKQLSLEDKEEVFNKIRTDHETLRRQYLQSKEDYNVLRRSGVAATDANFDEDKELEGELFKLGMKFDVVHEQVDSHLWENKEQRQPFEAKRLADQIDRDQSDANDCVTIHAVDQLKQRIHDSRAGNDLVHPKQNDEFENKLQQLHDEYNALMDRYRRLKQMAQTPDRDKEIDNLVKKLKLICDEAPEIFHLPPELEERYTQWKSIEREELYNRMKSVMERLAKKEEDAKNRSRSASLPVKTQNTYHYPVNSRLSPDRNNTSAETNSQLNGINGDDVGMIESSNLNLNSNQPTSLGERQGSGFYLNQGRGPSPSASKMAGRQSPGNRILSAGDRNGTGLPRDRGDRYSDQDSTSSYGSRDGAGGRVPRPRRHDHDFHDRKLRKKANGGSMNSLPDSGISDQGEGASALAKLPGPGKFKQMTKPEAADDVDSGFVGSVVLPEASQPIEEHVQQEETLHLHHPADNQNRPPSRQSLRPQPDVRKTNSHSKRPPSVNSSRRSSIDRYDEAGQTLDLTYEEESELSDASTRPQREHKVQSGSRNEQVEYSSALDSEDDDTDVTPRPTQQIKTKQPQQQMKTEPKVQRSHPSSKPVRGRHSFSSGEGTPTAMSSRDRPAHGRHSFNSADEEFLPQQFSPQKLKSSSRNVNQDGLTPAASSRRSQRENAKALRNLTTLGPPSDMEINGTESDTTRASSVRSTRLRALQDQIDRLRENMGLSSNQQIPPPLAPIQNPEPEYYDPFDDPYGFMRMPRRRANSFSGRVSREFDDWYWTLPNQRQHDDIPLGYAAADAYAENPPPQAISSTPGNPVRTRIQQRRRERERRRSNEEVTGVPLIRSGYNSDPNLHIPHVVEPHLSPEIVEQHAQLHHQIPPPSRYSTTSMRQQMASLGYFTTPTGAKIYTSQIPQHSGARASTYDRKYHSHNQGLPHTSAEFSHHSYRSQRPHVAMHSGYVSESGFRPRVYSLPQSRRPFVTIRRPYTQRVQDLTTEHYFSDGGFQNRSKRSPVYADPTEFVDLAVCTMCGGTGEHTHANLDGESTVTESYRETSRSLPRTSSSRRRSRSVPRLRPCRHPKSYHSRYRSKRQYTTSDLSSAESDDELFTPRRSRSLSRSRSRSRSYRLNRSRAFSDNELFNSDENTDLNDSLLLADDIKKLTRKMTQEVRGELRKYCRRRDLALSDW